MDDSSYFANRNLISEDRKQRSDDRKMKSEVGIRKSERLKDKHQVTILQDQLIIHKNKQGDHSDEDHSNNYRSGVAS